MPMNFYSQSHQKLSSAPRLVAMLGLAALFSGAISSEVAAAGIAENVFLEASKYTVKVRARVEIAFIEDEVGIYEGAGFLVDAERGWIVTNAHVTSQSPATISVAFSDEAFVGAQKLYVDPYLDLAVLRVDTSMIDRPSASLECNEPICGPSSRRIWTPLGP